VTDLLTISGVKSGYGGGQVLNGVSLRIKGGEVCALIGRNGVGKTTLMRTLIGQLPLSAGSINLRDMEIGHERPDARARRGIGYVPQGREIFGSLTVRENLQVGAQANRSKAAEMLCVVLDYFPVLRTRLQQKSGTMSGGEQQQLAIARALISGPSVILLDEPSEGVQPSIVTFIGETIKAIAEKAGLGVLIVEQDMAMVQRVADYCCVMDKGKIVRTLDKEELLDDDLLCRQLAL